MGTMAICELPPDKAWNSTCHTRLAQGENHAVLRRAQQKWQRSDHFADGVFVIDNKDFFRLGHLRAPCEPERLRIRAGKLRTAYQRGGAALLGSFPAPWRKLAST